MKKVVFLLVVMISATLLATAQEGKKKYKVTEEVLYKKTYTPVGNMVVKKPPISAKKKSTTSTTDESTPAWKRAQEENARRLSSLEYSQSNIQLDITDLKRSQVKTEVRLDNIEQKIDMLGNNLSNAQLLQGSVQQTRSREQISEDLLKKEKKKTKNMKNALWGTIVTGILTSAYFIVKNNMNRGNTAPCVPPSPNPNPNPAPAPTPNTNGGPAGVQVI